MSRVYQKQPAGATRRPPATRPPIRPSHPPPPSTSTTRGVRAPTRGRTMHTQPPRQERSDHNLSNEDDRPTQQERTTHVGDGFHMITPSTTKREQIRMQAENEQRQYEAHVERTRLHGIHEVHRLGGDGLTEDEVRRRQAEKYRREKFARIDKTNQDQAQKKQEEEKEIEMKKQAARLQSIENEKRDRNSQLRPTVNQSAEGATGWTDEAREKDRRKTMDRFLNGLTQKYDEMNIASDEDENHNGTDLTKTEKLSILHDTLPHIDHETLERYLEIYNGNVDTIVYELLN